MDLELEIVLLGMGSIETPNRDKLKRSRVSKVENNKTALATVSCLGPVSDVNLT